MEKMRGRNKGKKAREAAQEIKPVASQPEPKDNAHNSSRFGKPDKILEGLSVQDAMRVANDEWKIRRGEKKPEYFPEASSTQTKLREILGNRKR